MPPAGIQPRVLNDDGDIELDDRGVVRVARHRSRVSEVVEPQVQRAACRDDDQVGTDRVPVGKMNRDLDPRIVTAGIEKAGGFVAFEGTPLTGAAAGNIAFGDDPPPPSDRIVRHGSLFPAYAAKRSASACLKLNPRPGQGEVGRDRSTAGHERAVEQHR